MRHRSLRVVMVVWLAAIALAANADEREVAVEGDDGRSLSASLWGAEDESESILLLHGCEGDRSMFSELGAKLEQAGFRVLAPDIPTLGQDQATADVEAAYRYLGTVAGVLGSGCGGNEGLRLATNHPEISRTGLLSTPLDSLGERDALKLQGRLLLIASKGDSEGLAPRRHPWLP